MLREEEEEEERMRRRGKFIDLSVMLADLSCVLLSTGS